ncbi:MAG: hypothetical protein P4L68_07080, partial [Methylovirgula sp.]|nr:hypothetical protein [Methylovirgula sp.]
RPDRKTKDRNLGGYPVKNIATCCDEASAPPSCTGAAGAAVRRRGLGRQLLSGVALAALVTTGSAAAKADDSNAELAAEIHALKAQLHRLESRVDSQRVQIHAVQVKTAAYPAGAPGAYEPPVPWDKKFHLNGITITPGGFLAAEGVWRSRDTGGDFSPAFGSLPNYTGAAAHSNEIRGTARQSRVSLLVQGNYNPDVLVSGYGEFDFLGAATTANSTESNSYTPRVRHLYGTIDWMGEGFHILAGQTWSLVTMNQKGITPRNEDIPLTIDAQYVAGFAWTRQPQLRLVKDFGPQFWIAASAELPQTGTPCTAGDPTGTAASPTVVNGYNAYCSQLGSGGSGLLNTQYKYSLNHIPDFVVKAAWEPTIGDRTIHVEGFGLYTDLYDYAEYGPGFVYGNHNDTTGWGGGGGVTIPLLPKWIDVQGSAMIGRGIGRYGSGQLTSATFAPNGSLVALPELMFLGGAIVHATPQLDLYAYGGEERILSTDFSTAAFGTAGSGFGSPFATTSGCYILNGTCQSSVKDTWELTGGFWDKVYQGSFGSVRVGLQYAYVRDDLFNTNNASNVHFDDQMVYASFRYYPFDPPPPAPPPVVAKY